MKTKPTNSSTKEHYSEGTILNELLTKDLTNELSNHKGVTTINVEPYEEYEIKTGTKTVKASGPAIITINED